MSNDNAITDREILARFRHWYEYRAQLLELTRNWLAEAGKHQARADRLGNCAAGKEAFGDACMLRRCAKDIHRVVLAAVTAPVPEPPELSVTAGIANGYAAAMRRAASLHRAAAVNAHNHDDHDGADLYDEMAKATEDAEDALRDVTALARQVARHYGCGEKLYIERARAAAVPGWATLTTDGRWMEQGSMGWFALNDATDGSKTGYWEAANAYIGSLPDDAWLVTVDAHI